MPKEKFPIILTLLIPVQDTNEINGLTEIIPGTQNIPITKVIENNEITEDWSGKNTSVPLNRGEVLLFDARQIHRAQANRSLTDRGMFWISVVPKWYGDTDMKFHYQSVLGDGNACIFDFDVEGNPIPRI